MAQQGPHHRSEEFRALLLRVREGLQRLVGTAQPVLSLTCSGTGGLEAVVLNLTRPGQRVVCVNAGKWGARWRAMCRLHGLEVSEIVLERGAAVEPARIARELESGPSCVFIQACESSTGTLHPVAEIARLTRDSNTLLAVDGVSWVGAHDCSFDAMGFDALVWASQKALALPPGLAFVALSRRARERLSPRGYYFDLARESAEQERGLTAFTPATHLLAAADCVLARVHEAGAEKLVKNAHLLANATRAAMKALGLSLFSRAPSDSITCVCAPGGTDSREILRPLREVHGLTLANGQEELENRVFRIAHLGYYDAVETLGLIGALELVLADRASDSGLLGAGTKAFQAALAARQRGAEPQYP
jgi:aspartate aminotransferase-like enzyme